MSVEFLTTKYTSTNIQSFEVALFLKILPFSAFFLCLTTFLGMNAHSAYVKKKWWVIHYTLLSQSSTIFHIGFAALNC